MGLWQQLRPGISNGQSFSTYMMAIKPGNSDQWPMIIPLKAQIPNVIFAARMQIDNSDCKLGGQDSAPNAVCGNLNKFRSSETLNAWPAKQIRIWKIGTDMKCSY